MGFKGVKTIQACFGDETLLQKGLGVQKRKQEVTNVVALIM